MQGWTVLFFIYEEDKETREYALLLINALKNIKPGNHLTLLVFESYYENTLGGQVKGELYELVSSENETRRKYHSIKDYGLVNPGEKSVLASVLKHIKNNNLLRDHFSLFTWDHGSGFGIFDGNPIPSSDSGHESGGFNSFLSEKNNGIPKSKLNYLHPWGNIDGGELKVITNDRSALIHIKGMKSFDYSSDAVMIGYTKNENFFNADIVQVNMLTNTEINQALKVLERKTDLVIMMNCWMQMLETGTELAETVEVLVAAETLHWFAGYDYTRILNAIADNPEITAKEIAAITVNTIEDHFEKQPQWKKHIREVIISAVALDKIDDVKSVLERVCTELLDNLDTSHVPMRKIREDCLDFSSGANYFIDFYNYLAFMCVKGFVSRSNLQDFRNVIDQYIIHLYLGKNFREKNEITNQLPGNGFSIFHPHKNTHFDTYLYYDFFYRARKIKLSKTKWGDYLKKYREKGNQ